MLNIASSPMNMEKSHCTLDMEHLAKSMGLLSSSPQFSLKVRKRENKLNANVSQKVDDFAF